MYYIIPSILMRRSKILRIFILCKTFDNWKTLYDSFILFNVSPFPFHETFLCKLHTVEISSYQVESCSETYLVSLRMFFNKVEITLSGSLFQHASILQGVIRPNGGNLCNNRAFCVSTYSVWDLNEVNAQWKTKRAHFSTQQWIV